LSKDAQRKARIVSSHYEEGMPVNQIAKDLALSKATFYKYLRSRARACHQLLKMTTNIIFILKSFNLVNFLLI